MRISDFIATNMEAILTDWVEFARSVGGVTKTMDTKSLRDHAAEMLQAVVLDLRSYQSGEEQTEKANGLAVRTDPAVTGAESHGAGRAASGFNVQEMVGEFRALRASVLRLWAKARPSSPVVDFDELMRFNEAIDQALAESLSQYERDLDQSKEMFVAMLGHDLRTPLSAVMMTSQLMANVRDLKDPLKDLAQRIHRSAEHMNTLVDDLLDFTKTRIGFGLPLCRQQIDLQHELAHAIDEVSAFRPRNLLELRTSGDLRGVWDGGRLRRVFSNLLGNATQYGAADRPIRVSARGEETEVVFEVHNFGPTIAPKNLEGIFGPFKRRTGADTSADDGEHLGLGLYIAERIVTAHGGTIAVTSEDEAGTSFVIHLPRVLEAPAPQ